MKLFSSLTALNMALAATITAALPEPALPELAPPESARTADPEDLAAWCEWDNPDFVIDYMIVIREVDDVGAVCHRLWKGLAQHRFLCPVSKASCEKHMIYEKGLEWRFRVGLGCDVGCVQSAFWEATRNKFGALDLYKCK